MVMIEEKEVEKEEEEEKKTIQTLSLPPPQIRGPKATQLLSLPTYLDTLGNLPRRQTWLGELSFSFTFGRTTYLGEEA